MKGAGGEGLDVALDLMRTPGLRAALRAHALPSGIGEVLAVAAAGGDSLREARARTGYGEAELVEAARFYVQQVLLVDGMDAYRTLGASSTAEQSTLRDHHRLLLRWLHPDRSGEQQWDSALATRVNQAWNQLRNPEARAQYDAALAAAGNEALPAAPALRPHRAPALHVEAASGSRAAPITVALLGLACLVLAWLAIQREDRIDESALPATPREQVPSPAPAGSAGVSEIAPPEEDAPAPLPPRREAAPATVQQRITDAPAPASQDGDQTPIQMAAVDSRHEVATRLVTPATALTASAPEPVARQMAAPEPAPAPPPRITLGTDPVHAARPTPATAAAPTARVETLALHAPEAAARRVAAAPAPVVAEAVVLQPAPPPAAPADPLQLLREAEAEVRTVVSYLNGHDGTPPAWRDAGVGRRGADLRRGLHARNGQPDAHLQLDSPNWTLDTHFATVHASYRMAAGGIALEDGVVYIRLNRGDQGWLVSALQVEAVQ